MMDLVRLVSGLAAERISTPRLDSAVISTSTCTGQGKRNQLVMRIKALSINYIIMSYRQLKLSLCSRLWEERQPGLYCMFTHTTKFFSKTVCR